MECELGNSGLGIGRATSDTDGASEANANLQAAQIVAQRTQPPVESRPCARCRTMTSRELLMTSSRGAVCPDCYDDCSD